VPKELGAITKSPSKGITSAVKVALAMAVATAQVATVAPRAAAETPGPSKALVVASSVFPPTLDPTANPAAAIDEVFEYNVYQNLVQLDPKGQVVPVLATRYDVSPNGLRYTFYVRQGVRFSNGDPLTPADVVFSLKRAANPKDNYPYRVLLKDVSSVVASGDRVVVTLRQPDNQFLYDLAAYSNGVVLDPKTVGTLATKPVGTGPYMFASEVDDYSVTLKRNPYYWGKAPGVGKVEFRYFANANSEVEALKTGQVQVIDNLSNPEDAKQFRGGGFKLVTGPTNGKVQVTLNNSYGPLANLKVRQALQYATDKQAILQAAGGGYGRVIASDDVPGDPWYMPAINKTYAYNPSKAKKLLAEAGYAHGFSLTLTLPPYNYALIAGPLVQADLEAVGVRVSIEDVQWPLWLDQVFSKHDYQLTIVDHVEARDISEYGDCTYYWDYSGCKQVAAMLSKAQRAKTLAAEVSGYEAVVRRVNEDAVNDWLYNPDQLTAAKTDVVGLPGSGLAESFDLSHVSIGGRLPPALIAQGYSP
jgi:peptide/nickel transport system substrate-binding protein